MKDKGRHALNMRAWRWARRGSISDLACMYGPLGCTWSVRHLHLLIRYAARTWSLPHTVTEEEEKEERTLLLRTNKPPTLHKRALAAWGGAGVQGLRGGEWNTQHRGMLDLGSEGCTCSESSMRLHLLIILWGCRARRARTRSAVPRKRHVRLGDRVSLR